LKVAVSSRSIFGILAYSALILGVFLYSLNERTSIEVVSVGVFAALGALDAVLEFSRRRLVTGGFPVVLRLMHFPIFLPALWIGGGLFFAAGGGLIRRTCELGVALGFKVMSSPLNKCYTDSLTVWPSTRETYWALGVGIIVGAAVSIIVTLGLNNPLKLQREFSELGEAIDPFASAFFAAYGMEAGLKLTTVLPVPTKFSTAATFVVISALIALPAGIATGCGGGLLKRLLSDVAHGRFRSMINTLFSWPSTSNLKLFLAITAFGWGFYILNIPIPTKFGICIDIANAKMYLTALICAFIGLASWIFTSSPGQGLTRT
jgi:hypothetical protein